MYDKLSESAQYIQTKMKYTPKVGIVLGSGLGVFVEEVTDKVEILYKDIPHFYQTTVEGHAGRLILGKVGNVDVAILQGRLHAYEGLPMQEVVHPVRVLGSLGIETLILTNAAGGVNLSFSPGDLVCISDHINLMMRNPLVGPNLSEWGPRFPDMSQAYHSELRRLLFSSAKELKIDLKEGVYCGVLGPTYETPAEVRMIRAIGGDMVGMSTVPESIAANHFGIKVVGISCITNMAAGILDELLKHEDIKEQAQKVKGQFNSLLVNFVKKLVP